jgi:motility quorum-sensing regulator / GCU-specific mRNA interferase toxin
MRSRVESLTAYCERPVHTPIMGVCMEKRKPHFLLRDIKAAFADPAKLNRSFASRQGADGLGMDDQAVVNAIQALTTADFDKSMTSYANSQIWQDVYNPRPARPGST